MNPKQQLTPYEIRIVSSAFLLAATIFYLDTFTDIHSALATLYVITLLLSAETLTEKGTLLLAGVCIGLSALSYAAAHGLQGDLAAALRLTVAIAAMIITCLLIIRNRRARAEMMKFNAALQSSEERYRTIFEQSRVALWERNYSEVRTLLMELRATGVTDLRAYARSNPDFVTHCIARIHTVAANSAALELLGSVGAINHSVAQDTGTFIELMAAIFETQGHFEGNATIVTGDGTTRLVLITVGFPEDIANFNRVIVGMFDITEREMMQKALFEAQAELGLASRAATVGALSASLAHELNQPLGALVVNAQTLQRWLDRDPPDLAAASRSAERIVRDSQRASEIIHNTRLMLGKHSPVIEQMSLVDLVDETHALMESELLRNRVAFETSASTDLQAVKAVRIELQQVLINLITNAVQAMASTPEELRRISVTIEQPDEHAVSVKVRDKGPGLSPEILKNLFKPFCTTKDTGLGMGLAICRGMLEARGGRLLAGNHAEGGALFEIIVPVEAIHE